MKSFLTLALLIVSSLSVYPADGDSCLWLRFDRNGISAQASVETIGTEMLDNVQRSTVEIAVAELRDNWTGAPITLQIVEDTTPKNGYFKVEKLPNDHQLTTLPLGGDGEGFDRIYITSGSASGLLYGAYFILRSQAMGDGCLCKTLGNEDVIEQEPAYQHRLVKIDLASLPQQLSLKNLARACASIGINGIVITDKSPDQNSKFQVSSSKFQVQSSKFQALFAPYQIELLSDTDTQDITTIDIRQSNPLHLQYLAPLWQISARPEGALSPSRATDRTPDASTNSSLCCDAIAAITQNPFSSLNLYAFGRMAWMPQIIKERVAFEWLAQTFTENPLFVIPMRDVLMKSANPTPADIENFISIWHQMERVVSPEQYSLVEDMLERQLEDITD
jgi:hypothetical protein